MFPSPTRDDFTQSTKLQAFELLITRSSPIEQSPAYVPCSVVLRDITLAQLNLVLDFVYKGELAVLKTQLNDLAKACDYLQIKTCLSSLETSEGMTAIFWRAGIAKEVEEQGEKWRKERP